MSRLFFLLVPGIVFQSIFIGGGFASGREIMEYSAKLGMNGSLVIVLSGVLFTVFLFLAFQLARLKHAYDYRNLSIQLLGKFWYVFDLLFAVMAVTAIAVVVSAAGTALQQQMSYSYTIATSVVIVLIVIASVVGANWIIRYKIVGTILLYGAFVYFFNNIISLQVTIDHGGSFDLFSDHWITSGLMYSGYNLAVIPACLFAVANLRSRSDVIIASFMGGLLVVIPMALVYFILVREPNLVNEPLPLLFLIKSYLSPGALYLYYLVLFWTLVETGIGLTYAIIDRLGNQLAETPVGQLSNLQRGGVAVVVVTLSMLLAQVGIIDLVADYYSVMAWCFLALFALPLIYRLPELLRSK